MFMCRAGFKNWTVRLGPSVREEPNLAFEVRQDLRGVGDDTDEPEWAVNVGTEICIQPINRRHPQA